MDIEEKRIEAKKSALPIIGALLLVVASVGYIVYKVTIERAYNEKWKDYDECGLV